MRQKHSLLLRSAGVAAGAILVFIVASFLAGAQEAEPIRTAASKREDNASAKGRSTTDAPRLPEPKGAQRLSPKYDVWLDPKARAILVDGQVSLREGMLEMFACTRNTKEHESIVSVNSKAYLIHAGLLGLGVEAGHPVRYVQRFIPLCGIWSIDISREMMGSQVMPVYIPPAGPEIEVQVRWLDERGKERTARAQDWIKNIETGKAMTHPFVFAGSSFWTDEDGKQHYQAEGGDLICVSNFGTAMLDIPAESSQANADLAFEAFTERIPPLGTPVRLVIKPKLKQR